MKINNLTNELTNNIIESQLQDWPLARENFMNLGRTRRKRVNLGALAGGVQFNPARIRSTGADVSKEAVAKRACFLCKANLPAEQLRFEWPAPGWTLLVNPYPILPVHFTIVSDRHEPQAGIPLDMAVMAERAPHLLFFYNGARAGASAPDHLHVQAVLKDELPLVKLVENLDPETRGGGFRHSADLSDNLPFHFLSGIITPDIDGLIALRNLNNICGIDADTGEPDSALLNAFFWIGSTGLLRVVIIPRRAHRPRIYGADENNLMVSPGAIDMAGIIITPREEDFEKLDSETITGIYADTAFATLLPEIILRQAGILK
ncbi:MAG: DUF4922 domain-containing protein [Muribaculaceae bacterium]|nr:DUF4922 domain-containing protein [Muribaculaceae bacterium]